MYPMVLCTGTSDLWAIQGGFKGSLHPLISSPGLGYLLFHYVAGFHQEPVLQYLLDIVVAEVQRDDGVTRLGPNARLVLIAQRPQ